MPGVHYSGGTSRMPCVREKGPWQEAYLVVSGPRQNYLAACPLP